MKKIHIHSIVWGMVAVTLMLLAQSAFAQDIPVERDAVYRQLLNFDKLVKNASLTPNWMADGQSFWYAEGAPAETRILKVDPATNEVKPLFDTARLRAALTPVLGHAPPYSGLPFATFTFVENETAIQFVVAERSFRLQLDNYALTELGTPAAASAAAVSPASNAAEIPGPLGRWSAEVENFNVIIRAAADGRTTPLTKDGIENFAWDLPVMLGNGMWSPDGSRLLAFKRDRRDIHFIPVVHWLKANREDISLQPYPGTGELPESPQLFIVDAISGVQTQLQVVKQGGEKGGEQKGEQPDTILHPMGWAPDGRGVWVVRTGRLFKKVELLRVDAASGEAQVVHEENRDTFIEGLAFNPKNMFYPFADGTRFVWRSERDDWSQLYLYDAAGKQLAQLTTGAAPVQEVVLIDEQKGWVYYLASDDADRPYDLHLHRVDFQGKKHKRLTEATGAHAITFAPGKDYFLDTHSTVNRAPAVELRSTDGQLVRALQTADISGLQALNWRAPEEFRVTAADGQTPLFGVLYTPYDFDPSRRYPVIDLQYMGNFTHSTPRNFAGTWLGDDAQALTQLGFVVFIVDARGTTGRGKAFQDATYNNVGRIEVPDHVATLKQLASERPYMDTARVGITGFSWGGYFTLRALLTAPEDFHVGVAGAPVVDFLAAQGPIEPYMGLPQSNPEGYRQGSNVLLADKLQGKLLIQVGTSDVNVTFNHTMRMVDGLIKANKLHDLLIMPEETHGLSPAAMTYYTEARNRYFVEHLKPYQN